MRFIQSVWYDYGRLQGRAHAVDKNTIHGGDVGNSAVARAPALISIELASKLRSIESSAQSGCRFMISCLCRSAGSSWDIWLKCGIGSFNLRFSANIPIAQQAIAAVQPRAIPTITLWFRWDREVETVELEEFGWTVEIGVVEFVGLEAFSDSLSNKSFTASDVQDDG